jgi:hypothetical protein
MKRLGALLCLAATGCDLAYPEVVVQNQTAETVQLRDVSFSGCSWEGVLAFGEATTPGRCLPGEDRVHFQKLDAAAYCRAQAADGTLDGVCPCAGDAADAETPDGLSNAEPMWFNYQTVRSRSVAYGDFRRFEITLTGLEQDFSVPGPFGH